MKLSRLQQILERASSRRITVIGDLMLDEFVWGKVGRISPEAPVPVVEVTGESFYPGGAANVARNLREFVKQVAIIGLLGSDHSGQRLQQLLAAQNIDTSNAVEEESFRTIVKTRIIARHQQVVRVDREQFVGPSPRQIEKVIAAVRKNMPQTDAIIFEDYGKGFLTTALVSPIADEARLAGKIVAADPNPRNTVEWHGLTAVKPNRSEAFLAAGIPARDLDAPPSQDADLKRVGQILLKKWQTKYVLITLGEHGMMLFQKNEPPHYIPTKAREVFDVSGAGDTAIALFTLGLACGATPTEAAEIANHGSAVVVSKLGTATVTRDELLASFQNDLS
ncbi:MAG: D-glycero-beta-D-manno-heptose-7-phosphate kinase [Chthoniobacterales bacterium]|jgi:D-beta-D-heptose 7-phosphate kinase/D-beta-D-heptose 1-phosphate adenosyltransferase|nr:D-glycero-beta-D-manno-heptose-7-phosphate kinase [Chthoniobacterales bacterium]